MMWAWKASPPPFELVFIRQSTRRLTRYTRLVDRTCPCYGLHDCNEALRAHTAHRIGASCRTHARSPLPPAAVLPRPTPLTDCFARNFVNSSSKLGGWPLHYRFKRRCTNGFPILIWPFDMKLSPWCPQLCPLSGSDRRSSSVHPSRRR